jgi:hypothetical protein
MEINWAQPYIIAHLVEAKEIDLSLKPMNGPIGKVK